MEKKIAIITHYHNSRNYGGNLQAYALVKKLNSMGFNSEQICYDAVEGKFPPVSIFSKFKMALNPKKLIAFVRKKKTNKILFKRYEKIYNFNKREIPHSEKVYSSHNLFLATRKYDIFITGSDQVWNVLPDWCDPSYFLNFVPSDKTKISYAASMPQKDLNDEQKMFVRNHLNNYKAVSVRESHAVDLLAALTEVNVELSLDPTLLLQKNDWEKITSEKLVEDPYLFCYFFGEDKNTQKLAKKFAQNHNLKIVTLPYPNSKFRKSDKCFGDVKMYDAGIEDFLSLIKNAEYVFTDSFHAAVFSGVFEKQYIVFQRNGAEYMASRIYTLCELYETQERFCDTKEKATLEYIERLENIDYKRPLNKLNEMKEKSINYLKENLK